MSHNFSAGGKHGIEFYNEPSIRMQTEQVGVCRRVWTTSPGYACKVHKIDLTGSNPQNRLISEEGGGCAFAPLYPDGSGEKMMGFDVFCA